MIIIEKIKRPLLIGIAVTAGIGFIVNGFNLDAVRTVSCISDSVIYMQANYSQTESGVDYEGYAWTETSVWNEDASKEYFVSMAGYEITDSNIQYVVDRNRIARPISDIPYSQGMADTAYFTGFSKVQKTLNLQSFNDGRTLSIANTDYARCNIMVDTFSRVRTWYGMIYGIVDPAVKPKN